jgi:hypothetical protein
MGMFNYVKVYQGLPLNDELRALDVYWIKEEFQTKELEHNSLDTYIIRNDQLFHLKINGHWEDNPNYVKDGTRFGEFFNKNLWVEDSKEEVFRNDYTGSFTFGAYISGKNKESYDYFPDWKCVIVNGEVKELKLIEPVEKNSSRQRIEAEESLKKEIDDHERKMKCPVYSFYFIYYIKTMNLIEWKLDALIGRIIRLLDWLRWKGIRKVIKVLTPR